MPFSIIRIGEPVTKMRAYYVSKQVVPAAARILESSNVTEEQLLESDAKEKYGKKLTDFFG